MLRIAKAAPALSIAMLVLLAPPGPTTQAVAAADDCEAGVEVCGIMEHDRLRSFDDRCAARAAGASRILVGPCFDAD